MRIVVLAIEHTGIVEHPPAIVWPLHDRPLSDLAMDPNVGYPQRAAGLELSAAEAQLVRPIYLDFQEGRRGDWSFLFVPFRRPESSTDDVEYIAFLRDATRFENANGIIPFIWR